MEHLVEMSFDEWLDTYKPVPNHIEPNSSFDGTMFETFGEEVEYVKNIAPEYIWTYVDGDFGTYIFNGFHFVNRLGYFISEYPHLDDKALIQVVVSSDEDREDCLECGELFGEMEGGIAFRENINGEGYCQTCRVELELDEEEEVNA